MRSNYTQSMHLCGYLAVMSIGLESRSNDYRESLGPVSVARTRKIQMNWLNINTSQSRHPLWNSASVLQRGAWMSLVFYSVKNETDGVIVGAWLWTDKQWLARTGVLIGDLDESDGDSPLWTWVGVDLHIKLYPRRRRTQ